MRTRRRATIEDLRTAISCLPRATREAMLQGLQTNDIIVGAYTSPDGICPMLAAHRAGGRTSLISFAEAWDRVAFRGERRPRARRATARELLILRTHLEASLLQEGEPASTRPHEGGDPAGTRPKEAGEPAGTRPQPAPAASPETRLAAHIPSTSAPAADQAEEPARPGDPSRARELGGRPGWAWSRLVRRYDDYERILLRLDQELEAHRGAPPVRAGDR